MLHRAESGSMDIYINQIWDCTQIFQIQLTWMNKEIHIIFGKLKWSFHIQYRYFHGAVPMLLCDPYPLFTSCNWLPVLFAHDGQSRITLGKVTWQPFQCHCPLLKWLYCMLSIYCRLLKLLVSIIHNKSPTCWFGSVITIYYLTISTLGQGVISYFVLIHLHYLLVGLA